MAKNYKRIAEDAIKTKAQLKENNTTNSENTMITSSVSALRSNISSVQQYNHVIPLTEHRMKMHSKKSTKVNNF